MPVKISFEDLMRELRFSDAKEFRDVLRRNKFQIADEYDERVSNTIAWRLGQQVDWFKYRSRQRSDTEGGPLKRGISPEMIRNVDTWFTELDGDAVGSKRGHDYVIGFVCRGGFLEGRESDEFVVRFDPSINVIIGDRGSGKSTVLNLIGMLAGSLSEGSNILIEKLLSLNEPAEIEQTDLERRLRRTLKTYGINLLVSYFCRAGTIYCCTVAHDEDAWTYEVLARPGDEWVSIQDSSALFDFPLQFLRQGEIVKISESGDDLYLNQLIDSLSDKLHTLRASLARKLKKLNEQFLRYKPQRISYNFETLEKFIDDRRADLHQLRTRIRQKEERFEALHTVEKWVTIWRGISGPKQFSNVLSFLQTQNEQHLFYFLLAPTIKFINQATDRIYQVEERYRNVRRSRHQLAAREKLVDDHPAGSADRLDIEPVEEIVNAEDEAPTEPTHDIAGFAQLLNEFNERQNTEGREILEIVRDINRRLSTRINLLDSLVQIYRLADIEFDAPLQSLVRNYMDVLDTKSVLLQSQENECERLTKMLNEEELESRVYTTSFGTTMEYYERQKEFLERLKPLRNSMNDYTFARNFFLNVRQLRAFASEYRQTIDNLTEQLHRVSTQAVEQRNREYLFDPINIEMRQGNIYRDFQNLSFGQKSGVILKLVLGSEDERILVLDQPEDHLDAYSIARVVAPTVRKIASRRQIIIATHNSSLLLGLDPADITVLESMGETGRIQARGRLSDREIIKEIVTVLEGGIENFNLKIGSYEAFVRKITGSIEDTDIRLIENSFRRRTIDELRNMLQPVISDRSLLNYMRHQLKHEPLLSDNETRIGLDIENLRQLLQERESRNDDSLCESLDRLIEDLDADIDSFEKAVESIRLLDTSPSRSDLNLFTFLVELKEDYLRIPAGRRNRSIEIDDKLKSQNVVVDRNHLNLVFRNLLDNSFRATELRSVKELKSTTDPKLPPTIEKVEIGFIGSDEYHVELLYADNGRGIPHNVAQYLYNKSVTDQPGKDHGLGGVIIKKLLSLNNADISVIESGLPRTTQRIVFHRSSRT